MIIFPGVVSGGKSKPSVLYHQPMAAAMLAVSSDSPIEVRRIGQPILTSQEHPTYSTRNRYVPINRSVGSMTLLFALCAYPTGGTPLNYNRSENLVTVFPDESDLLSFHVNATINQNNSTYSGEHETESYHDHLELNVFLMGADPINFNYPENPGLVSRVQPRITNKLTVPTPESANTGDTLIVGVAHYFPLITPPDWIRAGGGKIRGDTPGIIPYLNELQVTIFTRVLGENIPENTTFDVVGG